ncbi:MAG: hypothetical protein V7K50_18800 [Nostoc sp.]
MRKGETTGFPLINALSAYGDGRQSLALAAWGSPGLIINQTYMI